MERKDGVKHSPEPYSELEIMNMRTKNGEEIVETCGGRQ
jgi:hypothetical protein